MGKCLVCIDGSSHSKLAFDRFLDEFVVYVGGEHIDNVYIEHAVINRDEERKQQQVQLTKVVDSFVKIAKEKGCFNIHGVVNIGSIREDIIETAAKKNVDLIVCGARGVSPITRILVGTTSEYLIHNA